LAQVPGVTLRKRFGRKLRHIRRERDLSQEEFSEKVGIPVDFLSLIERGINAPSFETIDQIAATLALPIRDLFDFGDE
jgi:transcriptional regulator with XRE-family HTH domain